MNEPKYQPSENDILGMLKHLRHTTPDLATPENAIKLLEWQHIHYKSLEELYPELIEEILEDFEVH